MNWTEVKIYTTTEGIEPLTAGLLNVGIKGFIVEDAADFEQFLNFMDNARKGLAPLPEHSTDPYPEQELIFDF